MICQVCRGRRIIRLPLYQPVSSMVPTAFEPEAVANPPWRDYPCPECAPITSKDRVRLIDHYFEADARYEDKQEYREHLVAVACHSLARSIERANLVRMQESPPSSASLSRRYRASIGVVAPTVIATLDAEREAAEEKFAEKVVEIAIADVDNWGSHYGQRGISKTMAAQIIRDAVGRAKSLRPKTPSFAR